MTRSEWKDLARDVGNIAVAIVLNHQARRIAWISLKRNHSVACAVLGGTLVAIAVLLPVFLLLPGGGVDQTNVHADQQAQRDTFVKQDPSVMLRDLAGLVAGPFGHFIMLCSLTFSCCAFIFGAGGLEVFFVAIAGDAMLWFAPSVVSILVAS